MPISDAQRLEFCRTLAEARRVLLSDEPITPEMRAALAFILGQFEGSVLLMEHAGEQLMALSKKL